MAATISPEGARSVRPSIECITNGSFFPKLTGRLCHSSTISDAGSATGSERSRIASMKL